ncbi:MAG: hypothetical protein EHM62_08820 [Methylococcus sp.]|nr:MAG: hypothetical protein EHM62_08820 [Methylococcus sp.]
MIRRTRLTAWLLVAFPIASFALLRSGVLPASWFGVPDLMLSAGLAAGLGLGSGQRARAWTAVLALGVGLGFLLNPALSLTLVPAWLNLLLARMFQMTLETGSEPLILRIARIARQESGALPPELAAYTRRLTGVWAAFFLALAVNSLLLALLASPATVWLFANTLNPLFMAAFFVVENLYRWRRYRAFRHTPLRRLMGTLIRHGWQIPERPI